MTRDQKAFEMLKNGFSPIYTKDDTEALRSVAGEPGKIVPLFSKPPAEIAYLNILEWVYANDGKYPNKMEWREAFIEVLRFNILGK